MRINLKLLRTRYGLSQEQMATRLGYTRTAYVNIELGKSAGSWRFWSAVKREFPEVDISEMAEVVERVKA